MGQQSLWARVRPPLWARWALSLLVAAAAVVALIAFVHHHNDNGLAHISTAAEQRANQEAKVVVGEDQKPHTVQLHGRSASAALATAVRADVRHRIATGNIDGPLGKVGCVASGHRGGAQAFTCRAVAAHVSYPFLAVATPRTGRAVYCKRDAPPAPSENIPVSKRCRL